MEQKDRFLVDCMITAGELDKSGYRFLDNDLKVVEVAKRNVPYSEFLEWDSSAERLKRTRELEAVGRKVFGPDYWMKYHVCHFCVGSKGDEDGVQN